MRLASVSGEGGPLKRFFIKIPKFLVGFSHFLVDIPFYFIIFVPKTIKLMKPNPQILSRLFTGMSRITPPTTSWRGLFRRIVVLLLAFAWSTIAFTQTMVSSWSTLSDAMKTNNANIKLSGNCIAGAGDTYLHVPAGYTVTLDLNGFTIDRNLSNAAESTQWEGCVIRNEGNLTINDSSGNNSGKIKGGNSSDAGGIYNWKSGSSNDTATDYGASLTINGGTITGNRTHTGGAITHRYGRLTINNCVISGNTATDRGGGIDLWGSNSVFTMNGGTITNNTSEGKYGEYGGGISFVNGTFNLGTNIITITGNKDKDNQENNVSFAWNKNVVLTFTGTLNAGTSIGVYNGTTVAKTFTSGLATNNSSRLSCFTSDQNSFTVIKESGEARLKCVITPSVSMSGWIYGGAATSPIVSDKGNYDGTVSCSYQKNQSGDYVTDKPVTAGTHNVKATFPETTDYAGTTATSTYTVSKQSITIKAKDQEITYGNNIAIGTSQVTISSGSLASTDQLSSITISKTNNSNTNVGTYNDGITASGASITIKDGSTDKASNYNITYAKGKLTIKKAASSITTAPTAASLTYNGSAQTLLTNGTGTGGTFYYRLGTTGSWGTSVPTQTAANNYNVYYYLKGDGNHKDTNSEANPAGPIAVTINKKALTVTANAKSITYGDAPANDGVTYSGFVNGESQSVLGGTLSYTYSYSQYDNVGNTYTITPKGLTSSNYNISFVAGTLTVGKKTVGLTWGSDQLTYNGKTQAPTATATGLVNSDVISVTVTGGQKNVGSSYTATASTLTGTKNGNYALPASNTKSFSIGKAALTVTAKNKTITYGDAPANDGVEYSEFVNGESQSVLGGTLTYAYDYAQYGNVGNTYKITPSGLTSSNYDISFHTGTLTVQQKEVGLNWSTPTTFTYDGSSQAPTATATGLVNSDAIAVSVSGAETNAGNGYTATASALTGAKSGNYILPAAKTQSFTINKAALTVTAKDKTITYGDAPANDGVEYSGFVNSETDAVLGGTLAYAYDYAQYDNVGDNYKITPSGLTSNNYAITYNTGTLTVQQKPLTITAKDQAISYGTTIATGTGQVTTEGLVDGDALTTVELTASTSDYTTNGTITPSDATTTNGIGNYAVTYNDGALTIGKVVLTITAKDKTITYGDSPANDGVTYSGFTGTDDETVLGGTLDYDYSYAQYGDVGDDYTITPKGLTSNNYAITFANGTLTVNPKAATVTPKDGQGKTYGEDDATLTYTSTGLVNGDVFTGVLGRAAGEDVGTYAITQGTIANANYNITFTTGKTFKIDPKTVGITWGETLLTYSGTAQAPEATATGLEDGDDCHVTVTGAKTEVGSYTATASSLDNANYKLPATGLTTDYEIVDQLVLAFAADQQWATWYGVNNYQVPDGMKAYKVTAVSDTKVTVDAINYIPAMTGVLLYREATDAATAKSNAYTGATSSITSLLKSGSPTPYRDYILYGNQFVLSAVSEIGAHRCYLPATGASGSRLLDIDTGDGTTGIYFGYQDASENDRWYDLQGNRIEKPQKKGLFILNGKKVVVK